MSRIFNNILWLLFDKVIRILGSLFVGIWVARYLGPTNFGVLNYAIAYVSLFALLVNLGLDQIVIREVVKKPRLTQYLLGTAFVLKLAGALIAFIFCFVSSYFSEMDNITILIVLIIAASLIWQSLDVVDFFYQSQVLSKYVVLARNTAFIFTSLLNIYFIVYEYSVIYFAIANLANAIFTALCLITVYKITDHKISKWRFSSKIARRLLLYSWPLALSAFLIAVHMRVDQVMIGNMMSSEQVGVYSVAVKLAEFWYFIPGILISTLLPYFVELRESDDALYRSRIMQLYSLMFWIGVSVGVLVIVFGEVFIVLLFGEPYRGAYEALVFNIWNGIFVSQALARGIWLISENLQKYRLYNNIAAVLLNVFANYMLIPILGITGAAISTLVTQAFVTWVLSLMWKPLRASTYSMIKAVNPVYLLGNRRYACQS